MLRPNVLPHRLSHEDDISVGGLVSRGRQVIASCFTVINKSKTAMITTCAPATCIVCANVPVSFLLSCICMCPGVLLVGIIEKCWLLRAMSSDVEPLTKRSEHGNIAR
jgi:hypothetical protein